ncbi:hypothetical protein I7I48_02795 [Histoplasma ohiense]|nr:hypothetical protein I7I48_02795 [Histoplasma ohiense (nom. inval.)]
MLLYRVKKQRRENGGNHHRLYSRTYCLKTGVAAWLIERLSSGELRGLLRRAHKQRAGLRPHNLSQRLISRGRRLDH